MKLRPLAKFGRSLPRSGFDQNEIRPIAGFSRAELHAYHFAADRATIGDAR